MSTAPSPSALRLGARPRRLLRLRRSHQPGAGRAAACDVFGVHLDRKATLPNVERIAGEIEALGREARFFNVNAADPEKRAEVAAEMQQVLDGRGETGQAPRAAALAGVRHAQALRRRSR